MQIMWEDVTMANRNFSEQQIAVHLVRKSLVLMKTATLTPCLKIAIIYTYYYYY
jgi:hypothetical protein